MSASSVAYHRIGRIARTKQGHYPLVTTRAAPAAQLLARIRARQGTMLLTGPVSLSLSRPPPLPPPPSSPAHAPVCRSRSSSCSPHVHVAVPSVRPRARSTAPGAETLLQASLAGWQSAPPSVFRAPATLPLPRPAYCLGPLPGRMIVTDAAPGASDDRESLWAMGCAAVIPSFALPSLPIPPCLRLFLAVPVAPAPAGCPGPPACGD